jgi:hypothetical protein
MNTTVEQFMKCRVRTIPSILETDNPLDTHMGDVSKSFHRSRPMSCARGRLMLDLRHSLVLLLSHDT